MSAVATQKPVSLKRAKKWDEQVEDNYRFQLAGYRDELEYKDIKQGGDVDRWPETGFVKKLQRKDGYYYYYNRRRECPDKELHKVKIYGY